MGVYELKIYVDADACPVKDAIITIAKTEDIPVVFVKSYSHFSNQNNPDEVETIYVDKGADVADYRIMKLAQKGDIIITQDYGLASLCLGKGCTVLHHKGFTYTHKNIDHLLTTRHESAKARRSGFKTKGPRAYTKEDEEKFKDVLIQTINERFQQI